MEKAAALISLSRLNRLSVKQRSSREEAGKITCNGNEARVRDGAKVLRSSTREREREREMSERTGGQEERKGSHGANPLLLLE